jgi:hypothetical protein
MMPSSYFPAATHAISYHEPDERSPKRTVRPQRYMVQVHWHEQMVAYEVVIDRFRQCNAVRCGPASPREVQSAIYGWFPLPIVAVAEPQHSTVRVYLPPTPLSVWIPVLVSGAEGERAR